MGFPLSMALACATVTGTDAGALVVRGFDVSVSGVVRYLAPRKRSSCVVGNGVVVGLGVVEVVVVVVVDEDGALVLTATVDEAAGVCVGVTKMGPAYLGFFVGLEGAAAAALGVAVDEGRGGRAVVACFGSDFETGLGVALATDALGVLALGVVGLAEALALGLRVGLGVGLGAGLDVGLAVLETTLLSRATYD